MSEINEFEVVDYLEEARSRVTFQFSDKPMFDKFVQLMLANNIDIQLALKDLMQKRSIDTAEGVQLDIIGEIVGQPRTLIDTALLKYFAFDGVLDGEGYGSLDDLTVGGNWYSLGQPLAGNTLLNDEQYRLFIKAKILKNRTNATPNDFLEFIKFVYGTEINCVISEGNAEFTILVGKELNSFEKALLTYTTNVDGYDVPFIPKPVGVKVNYGQFSSDNFFSFAGVPGGEGYGNLVIEHFPYPPEDEPSLSLNFTSNTYSNWEPYTTMTVVGGGKWATLL